MLGQCAYSIIPAGMHVQNMRCGLRWVSQLVPRYSSAGILAGCSSCGSVRRSNLGVPRSDEISVLFDAILFLSFYLGTGFIDFLLYFWGVVYSHLQNIENASADVWAPQAIDNPTNESTAHQTLVTVATARHGHPTARRAGRCSSHC